MTRAGILVPQVPGELPAEAGVGQAIVDATALLFRVGSRHRLIASAIVFVNDAADEIQGVFGDRCGVVRTAEGTFDLTTTTAPSTSAVVACIPLGISGFAFQNGPAVGSTFQILTQSPAAGADDFSFVALVFDVRG